MHPFPKSIHFQGLLLGFRHRIFSTRCRKLATLVLGIPLILLALGALTVSSFHFYKLMLQSVSHNVTISDSYLCGKHYNESFPSHCMPSRKQAHTWAPCLGHSKHKNEFFFLKLLFIVFSACGGIRTGIGMPVLTAYFPVLA